MATSLLERFNEKYIPEPNSGCWIWMGGTHSAGYGVIRRGGRKEKLAYAHVISYEMFIGLVPRGMELDHKCRVRCCVNFRHLEPVTHAENIRRGQAPAATKARFAARTHCSRGHEFTPDNTMILSTPKGYRDQRCRICERARNRANKAKAFACSVS